MLCAAYVYTAEVNEGRGRVPLTLTLPVRPSGPPDSTDYPTTLTGGTSRSFLKTILKLHSLSLVLTKHWAHLSAPKLVCFLHKREEEKRTAEKGDEQSNFLCARLFLFFFPLPI